uniref:Ionotropic glutamate receptor C-terminal domain-containing protein n=1 Tax=Trichuris muris TaxID=70415 RepID=A0A5S6Q298_TRIMR
MRKLFFPGFRLPNNLVLIKSVKVCVRKMSSQMNMLLTDDSPRSVIGARMLSTLAKYLQPSERLTVNRFKREVEVETIKPKLREEEKSSKTVISLLTNETIAFEIGLYAKKHNIPFIQIDENIRSDYDSVKKPGAANLRPVKGGDDYITFIPPWITMLGVLESLANAKQMDALVVLHDTNSEGMLNHLLAILADGVAASIFEVESNSAADWIERSCMTTNKTTCLLLLTETLVAQKCLKQLEKCSKATDLCLIVITTDITPFDLKFTFVKALWVRPHYVRPMREIDSVINWCQQQAVEAELFRLGRELEISFYYDVMSVAVARHTIANGRLRLSAVASYCLSDVQENSSKITNADLCNDRPEFGNYVRLNGAVFSEDIHLNIYHILSRSIHQDIYLVAEWSEANGIKILSKHPLLPCEENIDHYRIAVVQVPPFVRIYREQNGTTVYEGFCIDLIQMISKLLNFTYEMYEVPFRRYKRLYYANTTKSNTMNGVLPELHEGNANIALGNTRPTPYGEMLVDFTVPFYDDVNIAALMKEHIETDEHWKFILIIEWPVTFPFSYDNNRKYYGMKETERKRLTVKDSIWFCMMSFTLQGASEHPRNLSGRIIVAAYWIFIFLLTATYAAVLSYRLTVTTRPYEINSVEELFDQNKIHYSMVEGSSVMRYLQRLAEIERLFFENWKQRAQDASLEPAERVKMASWDYPLPRDYSKILKFTKHVGMPRTIHEGVKRVIDSKPPEYFVLLGEDTLLEYERLQHCNLRVITSTLNKRSYAMAVQQGSHLLPHLSRALSLLRNKGTLHALKSKWLLKRNFTCEENDDTNVISIKKMSGMFLLINAHQKWLLVNGKRRLNSIDLFTLTSID